MINSWREYWAPRAGTVVGVITGLLAILLVGFLFKDTPVIGEPASTIRVPRELIDAFQAWVRGNDQFFRLVAVILVGVGIGSVVGFVVYLVVGWWWNPNWPVTLLFGRIVGNVRSPAVFYTKTQSLEDVLGHTVDSVVATESQPPQESLDQLFGRQVVVGEPQPATQQEQNTVNLSDSTQKPVNSGMPSSPSIDKTTTPPEQSLHRLLRTYVPFEAAQDESRFLLIFLLIFFLLFVVRGLTPLARMSDPISGAIEAMNQEPSVRQALDYLTQTVAATMNSSSDPLTWPIIGRAWQQPGYFAVALIAALAIAGIIDRRWRKITLMVAFCLGTLFLVQAGQLSLPSGLESFALVGALFMGLVYLSNAQLLTSALTATIGHVATSSWHDDITSLGLAIMMRYYPFSADTRRAGALFLTNAYWAYRKRYWPKAPTEQALNHMKTATDQLDAINIADDPIFGLINAEVDPFIGMMIVMAHLQLANVLREAGHNYAAYQHYQKAWEISKQDDSDGSIDGCESALGMADLRQVWGEAELAEQYYVDALQQTEHITARRLSATVLIRLANWHLMQVHRSQRHIEFSGQPRLIDPQSYMVARNEAVTSAFGYYEQSLLVLRSGFWKTRGYLDDQGEAILGLGEAYLAANQTTEAREGFQDALKLFRNTLRRRGQAQALFGIGRSYWQEFLVSTGRRPGHPDSVSMRLREPNAPDVLFPDQRELLNKAQKNLIKAHKLARKLKLPSLMIDIAQSLALVYHEQGRTQEAFDIASQAIVQIEHLRLGTLRESARIGEFEPYSILYEIVVAGKVAAGDLSGALEWMERARSRSLLSLLATHPELQPRTDIESPDWQTLLDVERDLLLQVRGLQEQVNTDPNADEPRIYQAIQGIQLRVDDVWNQMERYDPEYTRKRRSVPLGQAELTRLLQRLPDRTAVVEYFACGDKLLALSITLHERTPRLKLRTLARSMAGEPWKSELGAPKYEEALSALVRESLKELLPDLDEISQIYFVPHGWIHGLPLHAARIYDKVVLLERAAIAYLPSLTALQYLEEADEAGQTKRLRRCLAFGYSASPLDADVFESEAKEVAERFGSKAFLGKEATRANLFNAHRDIDLIHFACHGMADSEGPFGAVLQLADGPLSPQDLMGRLPSAKIAVMTACFGQTSKVRPGDEAFGFARAMMYAGVRAVLAPLTATYLDQSVELTQRFYENLIDLQLSPAESLRRAQLVLRSDPEPIGDPHWAPYALVGLAESLRPEVL